MPIAALYHYIKFCLWMRFSCFYLFNTLELATTTHCIYRVKTNTLYFIFFTLTLLLVMKRDEIQSAYSCNNNTDSSNSNIRHTCWLIEICEIICPHLLTSSRHDLLWSWQGFLVNLRFLNLVLNKIACFIEETKTDNDWLWWNR